MTGYPKIAAKDAPELTFIRTDIPGYGTRHRLARLDGQPLPRRMFAHIDVFFLASLDHDIAESTIQARDRSGRRYRAFTGENAVIEAAAAVLVWGKRVIRERLAEPVKEGV